LTQSRAAELDPENYTIVFYNAMIGTFTRYPSMMGKDADAKESVERAIKGYEPLNCYPKSSINHCGGIGLKFVRSLFAVRI
jgi:hypothetical protein